MKLLKYEMKKLLFNKPKLILLISLFVLYVIVGFFFGFSMTSGEFELDDSPQSVQAIIEYKHLLSENVGKIDAGQYEESRAISEEAIAKYGAGEPLAVQINRDPILKFHTQYTQFGQRVDEYWNGPENQNSADIKGVYPLKEKIALLEAEGETNSYKYRYYQNRLEIELSAGEPYFERPVVWNTYFIAFDGIIILFFFLMVLTFFITPLFTQEVSTEMDSIILCSSKGRREIVTAKLLCAGITSVIVAAVYLVGFFIGAVVSCGNLDGIDAPVRALSGFEFSALQMTIGNAALLSALWLLFVSAVYGITLALISSLIKTHSAAFGAGLVILVAGAMSNALGDEFRKLAWPLMDFNFSTMSQFVEIFGGEKQYGLIAHPVPYGTVALIVCLVLGVAVCLFSYIAQKKRMVTR
jgi:ABC-type transport system involved in multi-copper enzyme maturation permease subunit